MKAWLCVWALMVGFTGMVGAGEVPLEEAYWESENAEAAIFLGRRAVTGQAVLKEGALRNGTIEVDLAVTGERAYPGIRFRMVNGGDFETVYVRPHKSNLPDTVQYAPAYHGMVAWQLYCGPGYTERALLPRMKWMRLVLDINGDWATLSIDGQKVINMPLHHQGDGTGMALNAFPKGQAFFSNFKFTPREAKDAAPALAVDTAEGTIRTWELSPIQDTQALDPEVYPGKVAGDQWQTVSVDAPGFLNISKTHAKNKRWNTVLARAKVTSDRDKTVRLKLGYSDKLDLFVNGRKVFHGTDEFQSHDPTFLGIVGLNDVVYVDLKKGENEIMAMVHERFGGWAIWAEIEELTREAVH